VRHLSPFMHPILFLKYGFDTHYAK
jgi:hypothetical protein